MSRRPSETTHGLYANGGCALEPRALTAEPKREVRQGRRSRTRNGDVVLYFGDSQVQHAGIVIDAPGRIRSRCNANYLRSTKICWQSAVPVFSAECEAITGTALAVPALRVISEQGAHLIPSRLCLVNRDPVLCDPTSRLTQ